MTNLINKLYDIIVMHDKLMISSIKFELHGLKRFNRFEQIENLKRINKIKCYLMEHENMEFNPKMQNLNIIIDSPLKIIDLIINSRKELLTICEEEYSKSNGTLISDYLCEMIKDFDKEVEIFSRLENKIKTFKNTDLQWNLLYKEDHKLHEYIKEKEDK